MRVLRPRVTIVEVCSRYLTYIINLVVKAYLFSKDTKIFSIIIDTLNKSNSNKDVIRTT